MKIKRFFAKSMQAGMKEISQVLGPDAVILSNSKVEGGVEIVAGLDVNMSDQPVNKQMKKSEDISTKVDLSNHSKKKWESSEIIKNLKPKLSDEKSLSELLSELREHALPDMHSTDEVEITPPVKKSKLESMMEADPSFATSARSLQQKLSGSYPAKSSRASTNKPKRVESDATNNEQRIDQDIEPNFVENNALLSASIEAMLEKSKNEQSDQFNLMKSEISELKSKIIDQQNQIENQSDTFNQSKQPQQEPINASKKNPTISSNRQNYWNTSLNEFGVTATLRNSVLRKIKSPNNISWSSIAKSLVTQMKYEATAACENGGVFTFLGPTGAGKTTSIGKLASKYVLDNGKGSVGIICMDHHQIGAQASLKLMADILDVTFLNVAKEDSLKDALTKFKDKSLVLIDTGGSALSVNDYLEQFVLIQNKNAIKHLLCLPATASHFSLTQYQYLIKIIPIYSAIITKLDESICAGAAMSMIIEQKYSTSYLASGQSIPKDINHASAKALFNFIDGFKHISHVHNNELVG